MSAPFAPTPISPVAGVGSLVNQWVVRARNNASDSDPVTAYILSRQRLLPTLGSVEYYNATTDAFVGTEPSESDTISNLRGGEILEVTATVSDVSATWTGDAVYQWRIKFKNTTGWSAYSPWSLFVARHIVGMVLDVVGNESRPVLNWSHVVLESGAADIVAYKFGVWAQSDLPGFAYDMDDPAIQALARWFMDDYETYTEGAQKRIGADLETGVTFTVGRKMIDKYGVEHGWETSNFSTTYTPPAAPTLTITPDPTNGIMRVIVDAAFNLADEDSSAFINGLGLWVAADNAEVSHDPATPKTMLVKTIGATYAQIDASQGTYSNEDTAYGTHEDQRLTQTTLPGVARVWYDDPYTGWIPAVAAENYSAVISVKPIGHNTTAELVMRFYDSSGNFLSETSVTATNCVSDAWTEVQTGAVTAPASTAYIRPTLEINNSVDDEVHVDNFAIARSDEVVWSPGGASADVQVNLSRKIGDGDWEYVWGASRDDPAVPESSVYSVVEIDDRAYPIGTDEVVKYRSVVVSEATGEVVTSAIAEQVAPSMNVEAWWLRCVDATLPDVRLRAFSFETEYDFSNQVYRTQGQDYGTVVDSGDAPGRSVRISANLFDADEYAKVNALLIAKTLLYVQRNIGDGFYIRPTGGIQVSQRVARAEDGRVRHFHRVSFNAEMTAPPEDITS